MCLIAQMIVIGLRVGTICQRDQRVPGDQYGVPLGAANASQFGGDEEAAGAARMRRKGRLWRSRMLWISLDHIDHERRHLRCDLLRRQRASILIPGI